MFYPFHDLDPFLMDKEYVTNWTNSMRNNMWVDLLLDAKVRRFYNVVDAKLTLYR